MSTDSFINCTPLEQLSEFLKLQNENARLKIEINLLKERLKAEEDKNSSWNTWRSGV